MSTEFTNWHEVKLEVGTSLNFYFLFYSFSIFKVIFSYWMHIKWHFWHLFHQSQSNLWSEKQFPCLPRRCNSFFFETNRDFKKSKRNQICRKSRKLEYSSCLSQTGWVFHIDIKWCRPIFCVHCLQSTDCLSLRGGICTAEKRDVSREKEMLAEKKRR